MVLELEQDEMVLLGMCYVVTMSMMLQKPFTEHLGKATVLASSIGTPRLTKLNDHLNAMMRRAEEELG